MQNNTDTQVYAGFFVRLAAYTIDWLLVGTVLLFVKFPIWIATIADSDNFLVRDFIFKYSVRDILVYLLGVTYFILLTYFTGATLGKRAMRLRVVSSEDRKPTFFEVAYRETVGRFLSKISIFIGYFMIGPDSKKRALHDRLADTRVVYRHVKEIKIPAEIQYRYTMPAYSNAAYQGGGNVVPTQPAAMPGQMPDEAMNAEKDFYNQQPQMEPPQIQPSQIQQPQTEQPQSEQTQPMQSYEEPPASQNENF